MLEADCIVVLEIERRLVRQSDRPHAFDPEEASPIPLTEEARLAFRTDRKHSCRVGNAVARRW